MASLAGARSARVARQILVGSSAVAALAAASQAQGATTYSEPVIKDGVSCVTSMVPVRDGVKLYTEVYTAVDDKAPRPVIVSRSPYARAQGEGCFKGGSMGDYARKGYVGLYQSVRGTGSSEGVFTAFVQEQNDGVDLIAWAAKEPWSNGKIALTQGSYLGVTQWQPAILSPPNLVAITPYITPDDYRDAWVARNGVWDIQFNYGWAQQFGTENRIHTLRREGATPEQIAAASKPSGPPGPRGGGSPSIPLLAPPNAQSREDMAFMWEWYRHPTYDAFWKKIDASWQMDKVKVPALVAGGWYDLFGKGTVDSFINLKNKGGTPAARRGTMLLMECCGHGAGSGPNVVNWGQNVLGFTALRDRFLEKYVKGVDNGIDREPPVQLNVMVPPDQGNAGSMFLYKTTSFPVPGTQYVRYNLSSGGKANTQKGDGVLDTARPSGGSPDSFDFDPKKPVPTRGGTSGGGADQNEVEQRPDVLVYTSAPATETRAIIGKVRVSFWAMTDGKDTDFTAKLVDVHPDGKSHNIVDNIVRARYRKGSKLAPELLKPNTPYKFDLDLGYTATMLKPGHKLRLQISSSSYPAYQVNLNTGASNETTSETRVARNTILHDAKRPSYLVIPFVPGVKAP